MKLSDECHELAKTASWLDCNINSYYFEIDKGKFPIKGLLLAGHTDHVTKTPTCCGFYFLQVIQTLSKKGLAKICVEVAKHKNMLYFAPEADRKYDEHIAYLLSFGFIEIPQKFRRNEIEGPGHLRMFYFSPID